MRLVAASIDIQSNPAIILQAFLRQEHLGKWWSVEPPVAFMEINLTPIEANHTKVGVVHLSRPFSPIIRVH